MAESKQYVAQSLDNGSIQISEAVIAEVVAHAVSEVKGVVGINTKNGSEFADFLNKKKWNRGLKITVANNNKVTIDCSIVIHYGQNVVKIASEAQTAIINAVKSLADVVANSSGSEVDVGWDVGQHVV